MPEGRRKAVYSVRLPDILLSSPEASLLARDWIPINQFLLAVNLVLLLASAWAIRRMWQAASASRDSRRILIGCGLLVTGLLALLTGTCSIVLFFQVF
jgi:membrane-anchored protein YejM (alkaline phosphatase superfamily)